MANIVPLWETHLAIKEASEHSGLTLPTNI